MVPLLIQTLNYFARLLSLIENFFSNFRFCFFFTRLSSYINTFLIFLKLWTPYWGALYNLLAPTPHASAPLYVQTFLVILGLWHCISGHSSTTILFSPQLRLWLFMLGPLKICHPISGHLHELSVSSAPLSLFCSYFHTSLSSIHLHRESAQPTWNLIYHARPSIRNALCNSLRLIMHI